MSEYEKTEWKEFLKAAAIRALWSFLEVVGIGLPTVGTIFDVDWYELFGIAALAALAAFIKSLIAGMPEVDKPSQLTRKLR